MVNRRVIGIVRSLAAATSALRNSLTFPRARPYCIGLALFLSACQWVGPESIEEGRRRYNDAIQDTTADQLLTNIIRVYFNKVPYRLEVGQIVSGTTATGSLGGSITGLGGKTGSLTYGTLTPMLSYSEQPSVTYQPLSGQALVQEFTNPVPISLITRLYGSGWPILSILEMITARVTGNEVSGSGRSYGAALNAIAALDHMSALDIAAVNSGEVASKTGPPAGSSPSNAEPDMLILYFVPPNSCKEKRDALVIWRRLLSLYAGTQPNTGLRRAAAPVNVMTQATCPGTLDKDIAETTGSIQLNTLPRAPTGTADTVEALRSSRRLLVTYSGYGVLKSVAESIYTPGEIIQVITPERFAKIATEPWNRTGQQWYTLLKEDVCYPGSKETSRCQYLLLDGDTINNQVDNLIMSAPHSVLDPEVYIDDGDPQVEDNLNQRRRLIFIQKSLTAPVNPFRAILRDNTYYYISSNDYISQTNFNLLELVISVQAVTPQTPLPQQTISVGARS